MENHNSETQHSHQSNSGNTNKVEPKNKKELKKIEDKTNKLLSDIHELGEMIRKQDSSLDKNTKENLIKAFEKQVKVFREQLMDIKAIETINLF